MYASSVSGHLPVIEILPKYTTIILNQCCLYHQIVLMLFICCCFLNEIKNISVYVKFVRFGRDCHTFGSCYQWASRGTPRGLLCSDWSWLNVGFCAGASRVKKTVPRFTLS